MNGQDLFRGMNYVNLEFIEEAETVTQLKGEKKVLSLRRPVLIAAIIAMLLMLVGCAIVYVLSMQEIHIGQKQTWQEEQTFVMWRWLPLTVRMLRTWMMQSVCRRRVNSTN